MGFLQIRLFGRVQISHDGWKTDVKITPVMQGLLAYLLLQRHRIHSREELAALFWGELNEEKARGCLNTTLWRLRCILEPRGIPRGTYLISNHIGKVGFNKYSRYWLDVANFNEKIKSILATPYEQIDTRQVQKLASLMQLYRGELLEAFYDDWVLRERENLRILYLNSLAYLMKYEKFHGSYERALAHGREILELDPLREEVHREMIRLYVQNHQRPLAVRQYQACCEILKTELDIPPMTETQALYAQIVVSGEKAGIDLSKGEHNELLQTLRDLRLATQSIEQVQNCLVQAIGSIETYVVHEVGTHSRK